MDVVFGGRGAFSVTYYDQTANQLIEDVLIQGSPFLVFQYQNVGSVENTGIEWRAPSPRARCS